MQPQQEKLTLKRLPNCYHEPDLTQFSHKTRNKPRKPKNRRTGNPIQYRHSTGTIATVSLLHKKIEPRYVKENSADNLLRSKRILKTIDYYFYNYYACIVITKIIVQHCVYI